MNGVLYASEPSIFKNIGGKTTSNDL